MMRGPLVALAAALAMLAAPRGALGLGPHEVALLINTNSAVSVKIGCVYATLRCIPDANVIRLGLPERVLAPVAEISAEDYLVLIWAPATNAIAAQGIGDHILAWAFTPGFPVRLRTTPVISIVGATFLRGRLPDSEQVKMGTYASPLFAGPDALGATAYSSRSLDVQTAWMGGEAPIPSMMLGYAGERGNTEDVITASLVRAAEADCKAPAGVVYFVLSDDVRSECRAWEFSGAARELYSVGGRAVVTNGFPVGADDVVGLMVGLPTLDPRAVARYPAGAMADHLTSFGAVFDTDEQTKISAWIDAGVTVTAGTVTEPYANWAKFPHARFFVHYRAGCTALESFFQSIRCPLQTLLLGDPLVRPYAPANRLVLERPATAGPASGSVTVQFDVEGPARESYGRFVVLLDGRVIGEVRKGNAYTVETGLYAGGRHSLRVVGYRTGLVRNQVFAEMPLVIADGVVDKGSP